MAWRPPFSHGQVDYGGKGQQPKRIEQQPGPPDRHCHGVVEPIIAAQAGYGEALLRLVKTGWAQVLLFEANVAQRTKESPANGAQLRSGIILVKETRCRRYSRRWRCRGRNGNGLPQHRQARRVARRTRNEDACFARDRRQRLAAPGAGETGVHCLATTTVPATRSWSPLFWLSKAATMYPISSVSAFTISIKLRPKALP